MTVITWDGEMLCSDQRRTRTKKGPEGEERIRIGTTDTNQKIELNFTGQSLFRNQVVLAAASAGNVNTTRPLKEELIEGKNLERLYLGRFKRGAHDWKKGSLFIMTVESAWHFSLLPELKPIVTEIGNKPYAIGSGSKVAEFLMSVMGFTPRQAAYAAMLTDKSCGGGLQYIKRMGSGIVSYSKEDVLLPFTEEGYEPDKLMELFRSGARESLQRARTVDRATMVMSQMQDTDVITRALID